MLNYIKAYSIGEAWLLSIEAVINNGVEVADDKESIVELVPLCIEIIHPSVTDKMIDKYGDKTYLQFLSENFNSPRQAQVCCVKEKLLGAGMRRGFV